MNANMFHFFGKLLIQIKPAASSFARPVAKHLSYKRQPAIWQGVIWQGVISPSGFASCFWPLRAGAHETSQPRNRICAQAPPRFSNFARFKYSRIKGIGFASPGVADDASFLAAGLQNMQCRADTLHRFPGRQQASLFFCRFLFNFHRHNHLTPRDCPAFHGCKCVSGTARRQPRQYPYLQEDENSMFQKAETP